MARRQATAWVADEGIPDRREVLSKGSQRYYSKGYQQGLRLTPNDVRVIRELWAAGVSQRTIARAFNIAQPTVCNLVRRTTWASIGATDRERTLLCAQTEAPDPATGPTTGRIQVKDPSTAQWVTVGDIRTVERLSDLEREDVAALAHQGQVLRFEPA